MAKKTAIARTGVRRAAMAPAKAPRQPSRRAGANDDTPYHHGALRVALLQAAEQVLERDGLAGLTLRAVARQAAYRTPPRPIISAISPGFSANSPRSASGNLTPR